MGLHSLATLLFNRPITSLLPQMNREPININNYDSQYEAPKHIKISMLRTMILSFPIGSTVAIQCKNAGP